MGERPGNGCFVRDILGRSKAELRVDRIGDGEDEVMRGDVKASLLGVDQVWICVIWLLRVV